MLSSILLRSLKLNWHALTLTGVSFLLSACVATPDNSSSSETISSQSMNSSVAPSSSSLATFSSVSSSAAESSSSIDSSSVKSSSSQTSSSTTPSPAEYCNGDAATGAQLYAQKLCTACHGAVDPNTGISSGTDSAPGIDPSSSDFLLPNGDSSGLALHEYIGIYMNKSGSCDQNCANDIATYLNTTAGICLTTQPASSSSSAGNTPSGIIYQDDFESYPVNEVPSAPWSAYHDGNPAERNKYIRVSSDKFKNGGKALNITTSTIGAFAYVDFNPQAVSANKMYLRFNMNASNGIGGPASAHSDLIKFGSFLNSQGQATTNNNNSAIKYGEAKGTIGINILEHADTIFPKASAADDKKIPKNTWVCIELELDLEPANAYADTLKTWMDGELISNISAPTAQDWVDSWQNGGPPGNWLDAVFSGDIGFGWQTFGGTGNDIYIDDLIVATAPIGCN